MLYVNKLVIFCITLSASLTSTWPTTVELFSLSELTTRAERILIVHCKTASSQFINGELYTAYSFSVRKSIKGPYSPELTLLLPGGDFQGTRLRIIGMPIFLPGNQEILFLTSGKNTQSPWPIGLNQGALRIDTDGSGAEKVYPRQIQNHYNHAGKKAYHPPAITGEDLNVFIQRIEKLIANSNYE